jgi:hypothetical protein
MTESGSEDVLEWVERIAMYCADQDGVPLIAGRVLGWLMICDARRRSPPRSGRAGLRCRPTCGC